MPDLSMIVQILSSKRVNEGPRGSKSITSQSFWRKSGRIGCYPGSSGRDRVRQKQRWFEADPERARRGPYGTPNGIVGTEPVGNQVSY